MLHSYLSRKKFFPIVLLVFFALAGCASERMNITYNASAGDVEKLPKPVTAAIIPVVDARESTKVYPKQVIEHTSYRGDVTYDINDRTVEEVFTDALSADLARLGVKLVDVKGIDGPLDKETYSRIDKRLKAEYPGIQVAFGARVTDFMATAKNNLVTEKVHVTAAMQFYVLDVSTGELLWSDYKTEWDDTVASANHNYMIEQLDQALANLMQKSVRDNTSLRDLLIKISSR